MTHLVFRRYAPLAVFSGLVFLFCLIFFCEIHPLVPYDADDWFFLAKNRIALPDWGGWNPTRVFPEVLEPTCALLATYLITPLTNDWVDALIIANGLVASIFVTTYVVMFERLLEAKVYHRQSICIALAILFFALHFLVFRVGEYGNAYMFSSNDIAAFYVYVLSNLLCASLVMHIAIHNSFDTFFEPNTSLLSKGLFILAAYFALLSNLFASIILISYTAVTLVSKLYNIVKPAKKLHLARIPSGIWARIFLICLWLVVLVFEMNGGRSDQIGSGNSLISQLALTIENLIQMHFNPLYLFILLTPLFALFVLRILARKNRYLYKGTLVAFPPVAGFMVCALISLVFLIVICAKAEPSYISRPDVIFAPFFFLTAGSIISLGTLAIERPAIAVALPLILVITITQCNTTYRTFKETNTDNLPAQTCIAITKDIVDQLQDAASNDSDTIELTVPLSDKSNNWPFPSYSGGTISVSAYKLGLTDRKVDIVTIPDRSMNERYGVYL